MQPTLRLVYTTTPLRIATRERRNFDLYYWTLPVHRARRCPAGCLPAHGRRFCTVGRAGLIRGSYCYERFVHTLRTHRGRGLFITIRAVAVTTRTYHTYRLFPPSPHLPSPEPFGCAVPVTDATYLLCAWAVTLAPVPTTAPAATAATTCHYHSSWTRGPVDTARITDIAAVVTVFAVVPPRPPAPYHSCYTTARPTMPPPTI